MGRPVAKKCKHCSTLSIEEAKELHGPSGDNCWNPATCHRRRSHYRHREDVNRTRRRVRRHAKKAELSQEGNESGYRDITLDITVDTQPYAAVLVLYRQTKQSPVHAIAAEVWQGAQRVGGIAPVHCMGMRGNHVTQHIQTMLSAINSEFGVTRFEDVIKEKKVEECPIRDCPVRGDRPFIEEED
ncbi:MAG: hypothetical protein VKL39_16910 [Leptolyngbyaceae bacterium]|nr:hypothetical protein [Leptolyngbyaceae bacterium]